MELKYKLEAVFSSTIDNTDTQLLLLLKRELSFLEFLAFLLFPLGFFVGGFITGLVFALIYNWAAEHWGGIKMEIEYKEEN